MDDLVQWLRAQLDGDEEEARRGYLKAEPLPDYDGWDKSTTAGLPPAVAARVLREIEAKRGLLAELLPTPTRPETDAELHARMAHPAYEYRTTEGPRKQWDAVGVPPANEEGEPEPGWERNVHAGRDGWERLDYTEESYWRRRLPEGQERKPDIPRWLRLLALPFEDRPGFQESWRP